MIITSPMVVGCRFDMVARNASKGFITDKECPEGHPRGLPVLDLLERCHKCKRKKDMSKVTIVKKNADGTETVLADGSKKSPPKRPPGKRPPGKVAKTPPGKKAPPKKPPGKKIEKEQTYGTWIELPRGAEQDDVTHGAVFCGDAVDMLKQLPEGFADLCVFDPAYESLEKHRKTGTTTRLSHSKGSSNDWFQTFPNSAYIPLFQQLYRVMKKGTFVFMFSDEETRDVVLNAAKPQEGHNYDWGRGPALLAGFKFWKSWIWDKVHQGMGYHGRCRYEFVLMFEKVEKKNKHRKLNDLSVPDILTFPRLKGPEYYPTEKPVELFEQLVSIASNPKDMVIDMFAGSGNLAKACINLGRQFRIGDINTKEILKRLG